MSPLYPGILENPPMRVSIDMDPTTREPSLPAVRTAKSPSSLPAALFPHPPLLLGWFKPSTAILSRSRTERTSRQEWENGKVNGKAVLTKLFKEKEHEAALDWSHGGKSPWGRWRSSIRITQLLLRWWGECKGRGRRVLGVEMGHMVHPAEPIGTVAQACWGMKWWMDWWMGSLLSLETLSPPCWKIYGGSSCGGWRTVMWAVNVHWPRLGAVGKASPAVSPGI